MPFRSLLKRHFSMESRYRHATGLSLLRNCGILIPEENKKSEPFSYREKVRIFYFSGSPPVRHSYGLGTAHYQKPHWGFCCPTCGGAVLFKSSYPLLQLKGKHHIKQKRQLSKAVSLVVRIRGLEPPPSCPD